MVSIWLTTVKAIANSSGHEKNRLRKTEPVFIKSSVRESLLPILLDPGGPEACQTMLIDGKLPGKEFVDRQRVPAAGLLKGKQTSADRCNDFGLAADDPPFGSRRGQVGNC